MGKGKKKKGHKPRSPSFSSPSSSPPSKTSKATTTALDSSSSPDEFDRGSASDAQISDLAAQQAHSDSESETDSPLPATALIASDAQNCESTPDLVAQQTGPAPFQESPLAITAQPALDAQIIETSVNLDAQRNGKDIAQEVGNDSNKPSHVIASVSADPDAKKLPIEVSKAGFPVNEKSSTGHQQDHSQRTNGKEIDTWCTRAKGRSYLRNRDDGFLLPSGEAIVKIPNSVIEKNKRSWDSFVIGQFYIDPPSQGIIHNIVNGIWSKQYRDIAVSKLEGNAFLFRIPNVSTRNRVITQVL